MRDIRENQIFVWRKCCKWCCRTCVGHLILQEHSSTRNVPFIVDVRSIYLQFCKKECWPTFCQCDSLK